MKFNHLKVPGQWQDYWTRFPEGYTIIEALINWVSQVDAMVDHQNTLDNNVKQFREEIDVFIEQFDGNLQSTVTETLTDWQNSGFLDVVISEALQWQLDDYIATNEQDKLSIHQQLAQTDLIRKVNSMIRYDDLYYMRRSGTSDLSVILRKNDELIVWEMNRNTFDDYKQLGLCYYAKARQIETMKEEKAATVQSGETVESAAPYRWMKTIGGTITTTFTGTGIDFVHLKNTNGGVWRFTINSSPSQMLEVETFNYAMLENYVKPLFRNLPLGTYTVTGEFIGAGLTQDPEPRGWYDSLNTFIIYEADTESTQFRVDKLNEIVVAPSNKELAMQFIPKNTALTPVYTPMHTGIATTFDRIPMKIIADGTPLQNIVETLVSDYVYKCKDISFIQNMRVRHPDHNQDSANFATIHHFDISGNVEVNGKMTILENLEVVELFTAMLPIHSNMVKRVVSSKGNSYNATATDGSITDTSQQEGRTTLAYSAVSNENDFVTTIRVNGINETQMLKYPFNNALYRESWIQHRDLNMQKIYTYAMRGAELAEGETLNFSTTFNCSKIPDIHNLL